MPTATSPSNPCDSQAVERHIKLVSQASTMATIFERRDGMIRHHIRSQRLMKKFDAKREFQPNIANS